MAIEGHIWSPTVVSLTRNSPGAPSCTVLTVTLAPVPPVKFLLTTVIGVWYWLPSWPVKRTRTWLAVTASTVIVPRNWPSRASWMVFRAFWIAWAAAKVLPLKVMSTVCSSASMTPSWLASQVSANVPRGLLAKLITCSLSVPPIATPDGEYALGIDPVAAQVPSGRQRRVRIRPCQVMVKSPSGSMAIAGWRWMPRVSVFTGNAPPSATPAEV